MRRGEDGGREGGREGEGGEWSLKNCFSALMSLKPEPLLDLKGIIRQGSSTTLCLKVRIEGENITNKLTGAVCRTSCWWKHNYI